MIKGTSVQKYKAGSYIFIEDDKNNDKIYLIENGVVELYGLRVYRNVLKKGDIFGYISSFSNKPRFTTAFCKTDLKIIQFTRVSFFNSLLSNIDILTKVLEGFADELRFYDNLMITHSRNNIIDDFEQLLYQLGTYYLENNELQYALYVFSRYLNTYPEGKFNSEANQNITILIRQKNVKLQKPESDGNFKFHNDKQIVFCQHEPGNKLYIIKEGSIKIVKTVNDKSILLAVLKENDIFGELALISEKPRNATAISYKDTKLLVIDKNTFFAILNNSKELISKIFICISKRIWFTINRIKLHFYYNPLTKIYTFLSNKMDEKDVQHDSKKPCLFNFGLNDLLDMVDLTEDDVGEGFNTITKDNDISFNFGQTIIKSPHNIFLKSRSYRNKDHLIIKQDTNNSKKLSGKNTEEEEIDTAEDVNKIYSKHHSFYQRKKEQYENKQDIITTKNISGSKHPHTAMEEIEYLIPESQEPGSFKVVVMDETGKSEIFSKNMKPKQLINVSFKRVGNAKIILYFNGESIRVMRIEAEKNPEELLNESTKEFKDLL